MKSQRKKEMSLNLDNFIYHSYSMISWFNISLIKYNITNMNDAIFYLTKIVNCALKIRKIFNMSVQKDCRDYKKNKKNNSLLRNIMLFFSNDTDKILTLSYEKDYDRYEKINHLIIDIMLIFYDETEERLMSSYIVV